MTELREAIAQAIHDGPNAQEQYVAGGIRPHAWEECRDASREQYLRDADAVLPLIEAARREEREKAAQIAEEARSQAPFEADSWLASVAARIREQS